jgi:hypothetical protein
MIKKTQDSVQTSAQPDDLVTASESVSVEPLPVDPEIQEDQKQKLIAGGIEDPTHLEIITDKFAGQGGSYIADPVTGVRTKVD